MPKSQKAVTLKTEKEMEVSLRIIGDFIVMTEYG
jgi:hypothetical protein